jgi:GTP cyclohydrolase I
MTIQIADELKKILKTEDVAVVIDAEHLCVSSRGIKDTTSSTVTSHYSGKFEEDHYKQEFLQHIYQK